MILNQTICKTCKEPIPTLPQEHFDNVSVNPKLIDDAETAAASFDVNHEKIVIDQDEAIYFLKGVYESTNDQGLDADADLGYEPFACQNSVLQAFEGSLLMLGEPNGLAVSSLMTPNDLSIKLNGLADIACLQYAKEHLSKEFVEGGCTLSSEHDELIEFMNENNGKCGDLVRSWKEISRVLVAILIHRHLGRF